MIIRQVSLTNAPKVVTIGSISGGDKAEVDVRGLVNKVTQTAKDKWIKDFSDHSLFYLEVQRV